jgi:hypothetical protein
MATKSETTQHPLLSNSSVNKHDSMAAVAIKQRKGVFYGVRVETNWRQTASRKVILTLTTKQSNLRLFKSLSCRCNI